MIAYPATLDVHGEPAQSVAKLLAAKRRRRGTPRGSRALTCFWQAVLGPRCSATAPLQTRRPRPGQLMLVPRYLAQRDDNAAADPHEASAQLVGRPLADGSRAGMAAALAQAGASIYLHPLTPISPPTHGRTPPSGASPSPSCGLPPPST